MCKFLCDPYFSYCLVEDFSEETKWMFHVKYLLDSLEVQGWFGYWKMHVKIIMRSV